MRNKKKAEKAPRIPTKMVLTNFPEQLLQEMDELCEFNDVERTDFIILAADRLLDYLDRKIGVLAPPATDDPDAPEDPDNYDAPDDFDDYEDEDYDDEFLEAAEEDDEYLEADEDDDE